MNNFLMYSTKDFVILFKNVHKWAEFERGTTLGKTVGRSRNQYNNNPYFTTRNEQSIP
jgi:hypothetical protein